jgi:hypothetical protein
MRPSIARGSSYLNVILAVALTAAAIGVSTRFIPSHDGGTSLERAGQMISSCVLLNRQKAIAGDARYGISYEQTAFRVYREEPKGTWMLDPPDNRFALPEDVHISPSSTPRDGWLVIGGNGQIESGDLPVVLKLRDRDGHRSSIRIMESGHVQESSGW